MKPSGQEDKLFKVWRNDPEAASLPIECPSDAEIFDAVMLKLPVRRRREIVMHTARCAACAESWRLAIELQPPAEVSDIAQRTSRLPWRNPQVWGLAAAASLAFMIGVIWLMPAQDPGFPEIIDSTTLRGDNEPAIQLEIPDAARLMANEFEVRWGAVQEIEEYRVQITNSRLETVFVGSTQMTSLKVPLSALSMIQADEPLYWHVSAIRKDGSTIRSSTQTVFVRQADNPE